MDVSGARPNGGRRFEPPDALRFAYFAILTMWAIMPFLLGTVIAQDAVPFVVAGENVRADPDSIYAPHAANLYDLPPAFFARSCAISPPGTECNGTSVAYVAPPQALVISYFAALPGPTIGVLLFRAMSALSAAGGMYLLWRRLAHRTPNAARIVFGCVVLLTPFFMMTVSLGQTSSLLFLSAAFGLGARNARWSKVLAVAAVFALTIVFKLFPIVLVSILLWQRRWKLVGVVLGVLVAMSLVAAVLVPTRLFGQFVETTRTFNGFAETNEHNGALIALVRAGSDGLAADGGVSLAMIFVRLAFVLGASLLLVRRAVDDDTQWAWSWLLLLFLVPMVWWHYLWVAIAAVALALAGRRDLDDRRLLLLLLVSAATLPPSLVLSTSGRSLPIYQALFLVVVTVAGWWIVPRGANVLTRRQAFLPE